MLHNFLFQSDRPRPEYIVNVIGRVGTVLTHHVSHHAVECRWCLLKPWGITSHPIAYRLGCLLPFWLHRTLSWVPDSNHLSNPTRERKLTFQWNSTKHLSARLAFEPVWSPCSAYCKHEPRANHMWLYALKSSGYSAETYVTVSIDTWISTVKGIIKYVILEVSDRKACCNRVYRYMNKNTVTFKQPLCRIYVVNIVDCRTFTSMRKINRLKWTLMPGFMVWSMRRWNMMKKWESKNGIFKCHIYGLLWNSSCGG